MSTPSTSHAEMYLPPWCQVRSFCDLDLHAAAQGGGQWALHYEQLTSGQFEGRLQEVHLPGVSLLREDLNLGTRQRGSLGDQAYGFAMSLDDGTPLFFDGQKVPDNAIMCGRGNQVDIVTPPQFCLIALAVDQSLLNPLWESMYHKPLATWLQIQCVLTTTPAKATALRQLHLEALAQASALAALGASKEAMLRLRDDILMEWIEALPSQVDITALPDVQRRKKLVDAACDLMLSHADEPLSMLQVCQRVGTSRRRLNYCFQDVLGTSPLKYLRSLRLGGVHRALKQARAGATVQAIAADWGFWHLGQFSQDYKGMFDELPSITLSRALAHK